LKSSTPHTLLIRDKEEEEEEEERTGGRREVLTLYRITYSRTHTRKRRGQTLESFLLANDYEFVHEILIMEDSGDAAMCRTLRVLYEGQMGVDRPSIVGARDDVVAQILKSTLISTFVSKYTRTLTFQNLLCRVFHLEDDWLFDGTGGFIQEV